MTRRRGSLNKVTEDRLLELRQRFSVGQTEEEVRRGMTQKDANGNIKLDSHGKPLLLTERQWGRLMKNYYETSGPQQNGQFFSRFEVRWQRLYQEAMSQLNDGKGVRYPMAGKIDPATGELYINPATGRPYPKYQVKPNPGTVLKSVRVMGQLNQQLMDAGFRLGILEEKPRRVDLSMRPYEDMSDSELERELNAKKARLAEMLPPDLLAGLLSGMGPKFIEDAEVISEEEKVSTALVVQG